MVRQSSNKVHFYLIEIVIVIFLITVSSVICLTAFTKANKMSRLAEHKTEALAEATAWIEQLKGQDAPKDIAGTYYFNEAWESVASEEGATFKATIGQEAKEATEGVLQNTTIAIEWLEYKDANTLLEMAFKYYYPTITVSKSER